MRVAFYNQMFGLDGRSAVSVGLAHLVMYYRKNPDLIEKKSRIKWTVRTIIKAKADIVGVAEVLAGQRTELKSRLNSLGFGSVFFFSDGNEGEPALLDLMVATRLPSELRPVRGFPVNNEFSGGGGLVHCYLPTIDTNLVAVHLARPGNGIYGRQLDYLQDKIESLSGDLILMGDFNDDKEHVQDAFPGLSLLTHGIRTCSIVPLIKFFYFKDIDHILARGYKASWVGKKRGRSDHRLVYADLVKEKNENIQ